MKNSLYRYALSNHAAPSGVLVLRGAQSFRSLRAHYTIVSV